jgi:pantetheine-phosphate adenylyltransferase
MSDQAIYPGSFDPVTNGHIDLIQRASRIFDHVIVAVANNRHKTPLFNIQERMEMLQQATKSMKNISVESFDGLMVDFARKKNIKIIIRGLRMISDFEFEFQMALTNRRLADTIETVFLMPSEHYSYISSTLLKEAASLGGDISAFVPATVEKRLKERLR